MELDLEKAQMRMEISIWMMIDNDLFFDFNVNLTFLRSWLSSAIKSYYELYAI